MFALFRSQTRRRPPRGETGALVDPEGLRGGRRFRALPPSLEAEFQTDTREDQTRALFRAALGAALVYTVQLYPEWLLTRDAFALSLALHFGLVTPLMLVIAAYARSAAAPLARDALGLALPLLTAGQAAVTYLASDSAGASSYLALIAIVAILANTSLPLSARASLWSTALCLLLLAACMRAPHELAVAASAGILAPLSLSVLMTLISAFQRNRELRRAFLLARRQRRRMEEVDEEARHDPLTGLSNRRRLEEAARALWAGAADEVSPVAVVLFDVDRFKAFNDLYGHLAGDAALRRVAASALAEIGAGEGVAARYGGEEFILVLPRTPLERAWEVAERLRTTLAGLQIPHAGGPLGVLTASFGVASADVRQRGFVDLTAEADAALYRAKHGGRNCVRTSAPAASRGPKAA